MDIFSKIKNLNLSLGTYVIFGSGPLAARGIKEANDIDLIVSPEIYDQFKTQGWEEKTHLSGSKSLNHDEYEMFQNWDFRFIADYNPSLEELIEKAEIIQGLPFVSLEEVKRWKQILGRPKDLADIHLIDDFLANKGDLKPEVDKLVDKPDQK